MTYRRLHWLLPVWLLLAVPMAFAENVTEQPHASGAPQAEAQRVAERTPFTDVKRQTQEFLEYNRSITLTPEQEAIKRKALTGLAAPCCDNKTAYTCCCPCNMAKTAWGLSKYLIAEKGYAADEVRDSVAGWFRFINPAGFTGDACYSAGGCSRPFAKNGCGGMR